MIISLFYRIKNRIKKAKPATRAGYRGIRADRTGQNFSLIHFNPF